MLTALLLGALQGVTEWLPVSSEGIVATVYSFALDKPVDEAVTYALWLHVGTVVSALVAFRTEIVGLVRGFLDEPRRPSPLVRYIVLTTLVSGSVGFPLLLGFDEVASAVGATAMGVVGALMLVTGVVLMRSGRQGVRGRDAVGPLDATLAGLAQGFAALPGLSRSGLTVAALLARGVDRREALVLSFLMSIPAGLGAGLYSAVDSGLATTGDGILAATSAAVVGFIVIRALLSVAERLNFGWFVLTVGALIIGGAVWQGLR